MDKQTISPMRHWMLLLRGCLFLLSDIENHLSYNLKQYDELELIYNGGIVNIHM